MNVIVHNLSKRVCRLSYLTDTANSMPLSTELVLHTRLELYPTFSGATCTRYVAQIMLHGRFTTIF